MSRDLLSQVDGVRNDKISQPTVLLNVDPLLL